MSMPSQPSGSGPVLSLDDDDPSALDVEPPSLLLPRLSALPEDDALVSSMLVVVVGLLPELSSGSVVVGALVDDGSVVEVSTAPVSTASSSPVQAIARIGMSQASLMGRVWPRTHQSCVNHCETRPFTYACRRVIKTVPAMLSSGMHPRITFALVAALAACDIDDKKLSTQIEEGLEKDGVQIKSITCPKGKKDKDGESFECDGEADDGTKFKVTANAKGGGNVAWELVGRIVDPSELHATLQKNTGRDFDCGTGKRIAVKGVEVDCKSGGDVVAIVFTDEKGDADIAEKK
jgi:hypothetical protein